MRLTSVDIANYRSLREVTIRLDPACRILVGINESGKSNILNAMSLLSDAIEPNRLNDVRDSLPNEPEVDEAYVRFLFQLDRSDTDELFEAVKEEVLSDNVDPQIAIFDGMRTRLRALCARATDVRYYVDLIKEEKAFRYLPVGDSGFSVSGKWFKPSKACPASFSIQLAGTSRQVASYKLIKPEGLEPIPEEYLTELGANDVRALIGSAAIELAKAYVPSALLWSYDESDLLPNSVVTSAFSADPESCIPLKNMFLLGGITDIKGELDRLQAQTINKRQNFLERIATKTTKHFRAVWRDYKNIEFQLRFEGDKIVPGVREKNSFDFEKRSDGFKRFVTFLLMISVTAKLEELTNTLLLVDEPEVGLHPSGARYLRDELIRISENNYVVYSTHSIFMIDTKNIERHYIVKKQNEETTVESARESNVKDNALGFSMFEILKPKNFIFEGWRDNKLFVTALPKTSDSVRGALQDLGLCHATGVPQIKAITPLIELARRECIILSDSDLAAKQQQRQYRQAYGYGEWKLYEDVLSTSSAITGEDFIKNGCLVRHINNAVSGLHVPKIGIADLPAHSGKLHAIASWLRNAGIATDKIKELVEEVKEATFVDLEVRDIDPAYFEYLTALATMV